jgi:hypothetical protein
MGSLDAMSRSSPAGSNLRNPQKFQSQGRSAISGDLDRSPPRRYACHRRGENTACLFPRLSSDVVVLSESRALLGFFFRPVGEALSVLLHAELEIASTIYAVTHLSRLCTAVEAEVSLSFRLRCC